MLKKNAYKFTKTENLLLNISAGLEEQHLTNKERGLLKRRYGNRWMNKVFMTPKFAHPANCTCGEEKK